jgi:hypothetical protein
MEITISLLKSEVQYDVNSTVHLIGNRENAAGGSAEQSFNFGSTDGEDEKRIVDRFMEKASTDLMAVLGGYLSSEVEANDNDPINSPGYSYDYFLNMPKLFNRAYVKPLRASMHEYLVNETLFKWFMRTKSDEAVAYRALADELEEDIRSYLNKRTEMLKIRPYPHI